MRLIATSILRASARRTSTRPVARITATTLRFSSKIASSNPPPLLHLQNAQLTTLSPNQNPFHWTIQDHAKDECWAIISPSSEPGGAVRRELISILTGSSRPRLSPNNSVQHPPHHPFLLNPSSPDTHPRPASKAIKHVSFATKMGSSTSSSTGEFTNYSARYGAIRDEDRITLYERLMDLLNCPVGLVAAQRMLPDPFTSTCTADQVGLFKYKSPSERDNALSKAQNADKVIKQMAPLLLIDDELLHRPVIALSNGQTRRARILSSLITEAELVMLEEPFSGIDKDTRVKLGELFAELHGGRRPRLVLVLREQDAIPDLVTHVLRVSDDAEITSQGPRNSPFSSSFSTTSQKKNHSSEPQQAGPDLVAANAALSVGQGNPSVPPIISLNSVSIAYGTKTVLDQINLTIHPGQRLVLAGDNGSGKTTLLALLLGDHPKSFSFPAESLSLFGKARDHPTNARTLLNRRMGHLSPELFNAFPRKSAKVGGLTVGEVVASGFEGVFARRKYTEVQKERVYSLLSLFRNLIKAPSHQGTTTTTTTTKGVEDIKNLSSQSFSELSNGSQAIVLFLRAIVSNPPLLVLDEPFQGMNKKQVQATRDFIDHPEKFLIGNTEEEKNADLEERRRMAIVLVSHYESEWPASFGTLLRLRDGKVVQRI